MKKLLRTFNLTKDYGNHQGAFDVSIEINPGEIVGFVGPNGAGKTTTLLMITGFIKPTRGSFEIFGDSNVNHLNIHKHMNNLGILMSDVAYDRSMRTDQILEMINTINDNKSNNWKELASEFNLDLTKKFGDLSMGNKKKVGIIASIMHKPQFLILDEPTSGLDPLVQQKFLNKLKEIKDNDGSVLLSSHVLSEVQNICDRIIMIKDGDIILQDTVRNVLDQALTVFRVPATHNGHIEDLLKRDFVERSEQKVNEVEIYTKDREKIIKYLTDKNIFDYYIEKPNLEDTFLTKY